MRTGQHERRPQLWPVQSDEPTSGHRAVRRRRLARTPLLVIGILLISSAGGWFGYELGAAHADARVNALEADQRQRAAERTNEIEQLRRSACVALARLPSDPEVERERALYGCGSAPAPAPAGGSGASPTAAPSPSAAGGWGALPAATQFPPATGGSGARSDTAAAQAANPAGTVTSPPAATPAPTAAQAPQPKPSAVSPTPRPTPTGGGGGRICLPILGCL